LIRAQQSAKAKKHAGIGLFEGGAGLGYAVDLREDAGLLGMIGGQQRIEDGFFSFERRAQIDQLQAVLLKDVFDAALLFVG
jgi:hypothetical protein